MSTPRNGQDARYVGRATAAVRRERLSTSRWCAEGPATCACAERMVSDQTAPRAVIRRVGRRRGDRSSPRQPRRRMIWITLRQLDARVPADWRNPASPFGGLERRCHDSMGPPAGLRHNLRDGGIRRRERRARRFAAYWQIDAPAGLVIVGCTPKPVLSATASTRHGLGRRLLLAGGGAQTYRRRVRLQLAAAVLVLLRLADHLRMEHMQRHNQARSASSVSDLRQPRAPGPASS